MNDHISNYLITLTTHICSFYLYRYVDQCTLCGREWNFFYMCRC